MIISDTTLEDFRSAYTTYMNADRARLDVHLSDETLKTLKDEAQRQMKFAASKLGIPDTKNMYDGVVKIIRSKPSLNKEELKFIQDISEYTKSNNHKSPKDDISRNLLRPNSHNCNLFVSKKNEKTPSNSNSNLSY